MGTGKSHVANSYNCFRQGNGGQFTDYVICIRRIVSLVDILMFFPGSDSIGEGIPVNFHYGIHHHCIIRRGKIRRNLNVSICGTEVTPSQYHIIRLSGKLVKLHVHFIRYIHARLPRFAPYIPFGCPCSNSS